MKILRDLSMKTVILAGGLLGNLGLASEADSQNITISPINGTVQRYSSEREIDDYQGRLRRNLSGPGINIQQSNSTQQNSGYSPKTYGPSFRRPRRNVTINIQKNYINTSPRHSSRQVVVPTPVFVPVPTQLYRSPTVFMGPPVFRGPPVLMGPPVFMGPSHLPYHPYPHYPYYPRTQVHVRVGH